MPKKVPKIKKPKKPKKPAVRKARKKTDGKKLSVPRVFVHTYINIPTHGGGEDAARALLKHFNSKSKYVRSFLQKYGKDKNLDIGIDFVDLGMFGYGDAFTDLANISFFAESEKARSRRGKSLSGAIDYNQLFNLLVDAVKEIRRFLNDPTKMVEIKRDAYQETFAQYFRSTWPQTAVYPRTRSRTDSSSDTEIADKKEFNPQLSLKPLQFPIREQNFSRMSTVVKEYLTSREYVGVRRTGGGGQRSLRYVIELPTIENLIEATNFLPNGGPGASSYSSAFMMLEFGTGVYATPVRPFASFASTPYKIPPQIPANVLESFSNGQPKQGSWFSYMLPVKTLHFMLQYAEGYEDPAVAHQLALVAQLPFSRFVRSGFPGSHVIFKPNYRSLVLNQQILKLIAKFPKVVEKKLNSALGLLPSNLKLKTTFNMQIVAVVSEGNIEGELSTITRIFLRNANGQLVKTTDLVKLRKKRY